MRLFECYKILNIEEDCSDLEVRTAYRRKAKTIHPDKQLETSKAADKFRQLNQAYKSIINHRKKLNKLKLKIIHHYEKEQQNSINGLMPTYKQMEQTFDSHIKALNDIRAKLQEMSSGSFNSPPLIQQFCD